MNKAPLAIAVLFVLAAIAGALLLWNQGDRGEVAPVASPVLVEGDAVVAPIDTVATGGSDEEIEPVEGAPEGLARIAREEAPAARDVRYLVVQVWDGKKGVPAAEADVFMLDGFEGPELGDPFAQHWSDLAEGRGQRFRCDVEGRVSLPPVRDWAIVTAQRPGAYGFAKVGREHLDVETIVLHADETVTVRVVDGQGAAVAGVPVGVVQRVPVRQDPEQLFVQLQQVEAQMRKADAYIAANPNQREAVMQRVRGLRERHAKLVATLREVKGSGKKAKALWLARQKMAEKRSKEASPTRAELRARRRTDDDGLAVFRHFQVYRHEREEWWPAQHVDRFEAVLLMPLRKPEGRVFAGRPVPAETLELRLPPTGTLALRTVDRDGRPFSHPVQVELRQHESEIAPWARVSARKEQDEATIDFPFVGLGLQFAADGRLDDDDFRWSAPPFAGPGNPGERRVVDLVVAPEAGMLYGRLLDASGAALAGQRPSFLINSALGRLEGEDLTLDPEGRFHLPYQVSSQHRAPFRFEVRRDDVRPTSGLAIALATLPTGRVTDLGELRIESLAPIARGFVFDDEGLPIVDATVQLQRQRDVGGRQPRLEFVDEAFTVARSDDDGHYELFGDVEPGRYRLRAQARDHFPIESSDLRRGEQVDLQLLRKSRVVGTVLTPDWMPSRTISVRLESATEPEKGRDDRIHDHAGKKYIYFDWVRPGTYNVVLRAQDLPDPFLRIDGLQVAAGQQGLHPRLADLDLGAFLTRFEVVAVDEAGQSIQPKGLLLARIVRPGGRTGFVGFPWRKGRAEVFGTSSQLEVFPRMHGYHAEPALLATGRSELRFSKIPAVELHLPGLQELLGATSGWLGVTLVGAAGGLPDALESWDQRSGRIANAYARTRTGYAALGRGDTVRVSSMMGSGRYRVVAHLGRKVDGVGLIAVELDTVDVRVVPGSGPQRVTVNVPIEPVQAAVAVIAQREAALEGR